MARVDGYRAVGEDRCSVVAVPLAARLSIAAGTAMVGGFREKVCVCKFGTEYDGSAAESGCEFRLGFGTQPLPHRWCFGGTVSTHDGMEVAVLIEMMGEQVRTCSSCQVLM